MAPRRPPPMDGSSRPETKVHRGTATYVRLHCFVRLMCLPLAVYSDCAQFLCGKRTIFVLQWCTGRLGLCAFFGTDSELWQFSVSEPCSPQPPVTQTVETVEKVPFQKMIFEKWERNAKKRLVFGVPHSIVATFWRFSSLLWEIFMNIFRTRGFSTVSLGS